MPWDDEDRPPQINFGVVDKPPNASYTFPSNFALCAIGKVPVQRKLQRVPGYGAGSPSVVHYRMPQPATFFAISGITKSSAGAVLGNCSLELFETATNRFMEAAVSNGDGVYFFKSPLRTKNYYVVAYKAGSPDVAGTTVNTLVGS